MRKLILALCLSAFGAGFMKAQVSRGEWSFGPVITTTNNFYGNLAQELIWGNIPHLASDSETFYVNNRWWIPFSWNKYTLLQRVETPNGKKTVKWWDWGLKNYSIGYHFGYMPKFFPLGFDIRIDYERKGFEMKNSTAEEHATFSKQMVVPTFLLKVRLGDYAQNRYNPIVEIGGSYDYAFRCKGEYSDKESLNNGLSGMVGIGLVNTETHVSVVLRYEHDFYNYFNKGFTPDGAIYPYRDYKTTFSCLNFAFSIGF